MTTEQKKELQEIKDLEAKTIDAIFKGQKKKVISLYGKMEQMFNKGTGYTRSLISNKFIFPLSQILEMNYSWGKRYLTLFPQQLRTEYCRQIYSPGI